MKDSFISQGKKYISAKRASEISDYSSDYIGQLCRAQKLDCQVVGRVWFVAEESLQNHRNQVLQNEPRRNRLANLHGGRSKIEAVVTEKVAENKVEKISVQAIQPIQQENIKPDYSSPLKYSSDDRPLLPIIEKNNAHAHVPVRAFVPEHVPVPTSVSTPAHSKNVLQIVSREVNPTYPTLARSIILRRVLNGVVISCLVFGLVTGVVLFSKQSPTLSTAQNMSANVSDIFGSVSSFFRNSFERVLSLFGGERHLAIDVPISAQDIPYAPEDSVPQGIAVVPSTGSSAADEAMKKKIRDSFSDEVVVKPDQSGTAGVITPVFRKAKGDDFVYVLVPVQGSSE